MHAVPVRTTLTLTSLAQEADAALVVTKLSAAIDPIYVSRNTAAIYDNDPVRWIAQAGPHKPIVVALPPV